MHIKFSVKIYGHKFLSLDYFDFQRINLKREEK